MPGEHSLNAAVAVDIFRSLIIYLCIAEENWTACHDNNVIDMEVGKTP